ncbi:MAG: hypothetical protein WB561_19140 [Terracidiphilus sp.]
MGTNTGHAYSENGFTFLFMETLTQLEYMLAVEMACAPAAFA